jgi:4-hydroxybenzoate polyprenyltransferase
VRLATRRTQRYETRMTSLREFITISGALRLHIASIGAMGTFTFTWLLCGVYDPRLALLSACDWLVVNWLNRIVDIREDQANHIAGTSWVATHKSAVLWSGWLLLLISLAAGAWWVAPITLLPRLAFHTLGMAYNWPLLPGARRIKQLYFWKNTASATGFLLTLFALPLLVHRPVVGTVVVVVAMMFFALFEVSYEILYDLRDEVGDREQHVRTYAVVHGGFFAGRLALVLMALSAIILVVGFAAGVTPWALTIMAAAPLMQMIAVVRKLPTATQKNQVDAFTCIALTWLGVVLLSAYHAWEWLGWPGSSAWLAAHPL